MKNKFIHVNTALYLKNILHAAEKILKNDNVEVLPPQKGYKLQPCFHYLNRRQTQFE